MLNSVYSPRLIPSAPKLTSSIDKPSVGISTFASNSPSRASRMVDKIFFFMNDPNDLRVGIDVGNIASNKSETRKFGAAKLTEGARSREN